MTNSIAELEHSRAIFVIGSNTTEQHPIIGLAVKRAARKNGAALVVADPRRIELADFADLYLQHEPGTDIALLNGMAHVILRDSLAAEDYIAQRTENFEAWREVVESYTPEYVSRITGVPAADIERAAHLYGENRPAAILYAMGITQHTCGHQNVLAVANLGMLAGNIGLPGGGVNPLRGQNNVQGACDMGGLPNVYSGYQRVDDEAARARMEQAWGVSLPAQPGLTVTEIVHAAGEGRVRALMIMGENPIMSDPDSNHVRDCLERAEFMVVQDIFLTETAELAHVVLPATSFAEKEGTFTNTERRVQRVRAALQPPGQARPDWQIVVELARRTKARVPANGNGNGARWDYPDPSAIMDEVARVTPSYGGITYARLDDPANLPGLQWPCPDPTHPGTAYLHKDKFSRGLGRFSPVHHQPADELPDDDYPLILTTGRRLQHWHTRSMTGRVEGLEFLVPEERLEINPADAESLGVADGDWVSVRSRRGELRVRAWLRQGIRPGVVFLTFHFAEALGNVLTNAAIDPIAKIPEYKVCAVVVRKAKAAEAAMSG